MHILISIFLSLLCSLIELYKGKNPGTKERSVSVFLKYLLFFNVGITGVVGAFFHTYFADETARNIGWATGSMFQFEIAMANLALGVAGILCLWQKGKFWLAVSVINFVLLIGCAYGHILEMNRGNFAPYNTGVLLYVGDIALPVIILVLALMNNRYEKLSDLIK